MRDDLVAIPANPVPDGASCSVALAADGIALRMAHWSETDGPLSGTLLLIQGRAEFIEKYFETVAHFRARGLHVATFDWRGQGGSQRLTRNPSKGHVRRFADYLLDLDAVLAMLERLDKPKPYFVLAHSMGAAILVAALARGLPVVSRAALSAPMLGLTAEMAPTYTAIATLAATGIGLGRLFVPGGGPRSISTKPFENNRLSSDLGRYERNRSIIEAAPDLAIGDPTIGWVATACRAMAVLADPKVPRRIATPLLIVASGADRVVSTRVTETFAAQLKTGGAIVVAGARHELLMESDLVRDQALAAFDAFIPGGGRFARAPAELPGLTVRN